MVVNLGPALRQAWVGYRLRLDAQLAAAGFADARFPDGRVLRLCAAPGEITISQIGRELGITRQGASKVVTGLAERGYVTSTPSSADRREKVVSLTPRAQAFLKARRRAARRIERELRAQVGAEAFESLALLLDALSGVHSPRLSDYLRGRVEHSYIDP